MKLSKCKVCRTPFQKMSIMHRACSPDCSIALVVKERDERAKKQAREEHAALKEKCKTRQDYIREAQTAFNSFIRARDEHLPCICCGKTAKEKYGGSWDAGHFLSRGAYPELRFNEDNVHKQLKSCNAGSAKYSHKGKTVGQGFREGLIAKIGLSKVEALEAFHPPAKWTIEELKEIKRDYVAKLKALVKTQTAF